MTKEEWEQQKTEFGSTFATYEDYRCAVDGVLSMLGKPIEPPPVLFPCLRCNARERAPSSSWCDECYLVHECNPARGRQGFPPLSMDEYLRLMNRKTP